MLILISPAKKLDLNPYENIHKLNITVPKFVDKAQELVNILQQYSPSKLCELMHISADLANLNAARFANWGINHINNEYIKPAIFMFNGDVYEGIKAASFTKEQLEYVNQHLIILSGLYGILRPLDNIYPYRLEMGTKLQHHAAEAANLYSFWHDAPTKAINEYINADDIIINLASDEYFKVVSSKLIKNKIVKIIFEQPNKTGIYKNISFLTKYARGLMVQYIVQNQINKLEGLYDFNIEGYKHEANLSNSDRLVFRQYHNT